MLENYKKLIKCMQVLEGFEKYRVNNGYGARLSTFSYPRFSGSFDYNKDKLTLTTVNGTKYHVYAFLQNDRYRPKIARNKLQLGTNNDRKPCFNIQYKDDYISITSPALQSYDLVLEDLFTDEQHFQYSLIENLPSTDKLKEAQQIFNLLFKNNIGYIGALDLQYFDYDSFLRWMSNKTCYVADYWECLNEW